MRDLLAGIDGAAVAERYEVFNRAVVICVSNGSYGYFFWRRRRLGLTGGSGAAGREGGTFPDLGSGRVAERQTAEEGLGWLRHPDEERGVADSSETYSRPSAEWRSAGVLTGCQ